MDYESWCALSDDELVGRDVGEVNLAAAFGLPGAEELEIPACRRQLDEWAARVGQATACWWPKFHASPAEYNDSAAHFRMMALATVLQLDLGVRYDPASMTGLYDARDPRRHFIHGPLLGEGGTCSSLSVLYLAVGRRLGYPLKLVPAREHLFLRWEARGERFNVECTMVGFEPRSDDYYRQWPFPISDEEVARGDYLRSMTPRQELACFLHQRGKCWLDSLQFGRALEAMYHAWRLDRRYQGDRAAATMSYRIVKNITLGRQSGDIEFPATFERLIERGSQPATEAWEHWALPIAKTELLRIFTAQSKAARAEGWDGLSVCL